MAATITSTGLGSGLDIKTLVSNLVAAEQTPATTKLDTQQAKITTQISAYGTLNSALSTLQGSLSTLKNISTFQKLTATSSDSSSVTASTFSNADAGSYNLEVTQLAKNQTLASSALPSATSTVGTGTLTINFGTSTFDANGIPTGFAQDGSQAALTLNVDATNNTLAGLSDAINKAKVGVTAVVVTDNTGSRLVLNSTATGAKSSMQVNVVETGAPGLSSLAFNVGAHNMTQHQVAQDANVAINGLPVVSSTNTVSTTIKGLTLNLLQAQPGKIVTVGVSQSTADIATAITGFVKNFNNVVTTVNPLTKFDAATQTGGLLQSDSTLRNVMGKIRSELGSMVSGLNGSIKSLTDIGITTQADGTLVLDSTKLNTQLTSNPSGVAGVFAVQGTSTNANVSFISSTTATNAGQYAINVTQVATQGVLNGTSPSSLTVDSSNNNFAITVDGIQSGTVALTQKTYASYADMATEMQTRINADSTIKSAGVSVGVTYDSVNNYMVLTSKSYGASSQVAITANTTLLGLSVATGTPGLDVAGTIGGLAATGNGRTLTSTAGNSIGLKLLIGDNVIGDKGTINFSRGIMERLDKVISGAIGTTGTFKNRNDGLQKNLAQIAADRIKLTDKMSKLQTSLLAKFNAMDALVGQMQSTASFLNQQFYKATSTN